MLLDFHLPQTQEVPGHAVDYLSDRNTYICLCPGKVSSISTARTDPDVHLRLGVRLVQHVENAEATFNNNVLIPHKL